MNNPMNTNLVRTSLALTLALAVWSPSSLRGAAGSVDQPKPAAGAMENHPSMTAHDPAMTDDSHAMMAEMKAQDVALAAQVARMNRAPTDEKLELMAAIITTMVKQRTEMTARMEQMRGQMAPHMNMGDRSAAPRAMMPGPGEKPAVAKEKQE